MYDACMQMITLVLNTMRFCQFQTHNTDTDCNVLLLLCYVVCCWCWWLVSVWLSLSPGMWLVLELNRCQSHQPIWMNVCTRLEWTVSSQPPLKESGYVQNSSVFFFLFHHDRQFRFLFAFSSDFMSIVWITFGIVNLVFICSQNRV